MFRIRIRIMENLLVPDPDSGGKKLVPVPEPKLKNEQVDQKKTFFKNKY